MPFTRTWDSSCPRVYEEWETDGVMWTVQDLPPEDDDLSVQLLIDNFLEDETLCAELDIYNDPASVNGSRTYWKSALAARTSLACYREENGRRVLAALNVCPVKCVDDRHEDISEVEGEKWRDVIGVLSYADEKLDAFKSMQIDKYLGGAGLLVLKEYRGERLGAKLLRAREPLCRHLGIKTTITVFTGPASQKSAARCGFWTLMEISFAELAAAGLPYPADDSKIIKVMANKYD